MARKHSGRKGAAIVAVIAAMAFFGGAQAAAAANVQVSPPAPAFEVGFLAGELASWAEEASWAES